jgi:hypothetical protein
MSWNKHPTTFVILSEARNLSVFLGIAQKKKEGFLAPLGMTTPLFLPQTS